MKTFKKPCLVIQIAAERSQPLGGITSAPMAQQYEMNMRHRMSGRFQNIFSKQSSN